MRGSLYSHQGGDLLERWFPVPQFLYPQSVGIDISDKSIKWLSLTKSGEGYVVDRYGSEPLPEGIVHNGQVTDPATLGEHLRALSRSLGGIKYAHAALPEEEAYVFGMAVPHDSSHEQIMRLIEFEFEGRVPIAPAEAVYDYERIEVTSDVLEIGVAVFPKEVANRYADAFALANINLLSLEIEARSIARAIMRRGVPEPITLIADFGRARTGFALVKNGVPMFTSTVSVGGDTITNIVANELAITEEDTVHFKNEEGLLAEGDNAKIVEKIKGTAGALADEIARHFHYWDTRRNEHGERMTPVGRVLLVGGSANLKGLADVIAGRIQAETGRGDIWCNICSFDEYIPPINRHSSLEYAAAAGLALRGVDRL